MTLAVEISSAFDPDPERSVVGSGNDDRMDFDIRPGFVIPDPGPDFEIRDPGVVQAEGFDRSAHRIKNPHRSVVAAVRDHLRTKIQRNKGNSKPLTSFLLYSLAYYLGAPLATAIIPCRFHHLNHCSQKSPDLLRLRR